MHLQSNPIEFSKFNQTLLVDAFGQSYWFLPKQLQHGEVSGEPVHNSIDRYWVESLLQKHSSIWGYQFDLSRLYQQLSNDYLAHNKSHQDKLSWLSSSIVNGDVAVFKGESFAPTPPTDAEGGVPVATLPENVVARAAPAQEALGQGGQTTEDILEALDLYCALPDGSPAANLPYKATLADGSVFEGMLDARGQANLQNLKPNNVEVEFGEQPDGAAIAATRAEITAVLSSIIAAERAEGAKIAAEYGELNTLEKGASSIGSLLTGVGGALGDAAEFTYNLIELGSMQGQLKRALNAGWDAYNVDDNKGWAESFASNWSAEQHQAYVKALGFDPSSITKENLTEAYETASFISDDSETQTVLLQFVKDFADAQHHTELTEMGGAAIFDIVLGAILVALTGGAGTAVVAANKVRHLDKLGGLFKTLAKQLKKKAQFKTKSGRTGSKVEQQIAKPAGAEVTVNRAPSNTAKAAVPKEVPMSQAEYDRIINLEKGNRPDDVTDYLPDKYVESHLLKFENEGGAFIQIEAWLDNPEFKSYQPKGKFVGLSSEMDQVIARYKASGNDWKILRDELNLGPNEDFSNTRIVYVKLPPKDSRFKYEMPTGNEGGAYKNEWVPGGFTKNGTSEATLTGGDQILHNNNVDNIMNMFDANAELLQ